MTILSKMKAGASVYAYAIFMYHFYVWLVAFWLSCFWFTTHVLNKSTDYKNFSKWYTWKMNASQSWRKDIKSFHVNYTRRPFEFLSIWIFYFLFFVSMNKNFIFFSFIDSPKRKTFTSMFWSFLFFSSHLFTSLNIGKILQKQGWLLKAKG